MSLSKKHYREVANAIGKAKIHQENGWHELSIDSIVDVLCDVFKRDNKNFDRSIFKSFIEEKYQEAAKIREATNQKEKINS